MIKNDKKYLKMFVVIFIIIIIIAIITGVIFINKNSTNNFIRQNDDSIIIDFSKVDKITVSYLSDDKQLTDADKTQLISDLQMLNYPIIHEQQLIVSTDYKIDFNNGIYFTFGQYGTEVDIYENNKRRYTTELPDNILNYIRRIFGNVDDQTNTNNMYNTNQVNVK